MNKLTLLLTNGKSIIDLDRFINTKYGYKMKVKNIAVYWKFRNVLENINDVIVSNNSKVTSKEGYWTFHMISEKLSESEIKLDRNRYNTCKIYSKNNSVNLKNLAPLLGFPKDKVIQANTWVESPSTVDVNLGLRYVTVECGSVDADKNFDHRGRRSKVIATLPITSEQSLNSSVTFYDNISSEVSVLNGDHNMFEFDVNANIGNKVGLEVMFELYERKLSSPNKN